MASWKPQFQVGGDDKWYDNAQRFATKEEALASAEARYVRWTMASGYRVIETDDPVTYKRVDHLDERIDETYKI